MVNEAAKTPTLSSQTEDKTSLSPKDSPLSHMSVLVVEDDPASRKYMRLMLNHQHMDVLLAENGEDALKQVKGKKFDGMLLDIALGSGISGLELGETLKKKKAYRDTPMIAVTAYERESLGDMDARGFTGYLRKPYHPRDLIKVLENQLITDI